MNNTVYEVIIGVVVLCLLILVIPLFRNNMDLISVSAAKVNDVDKLQAQSMVPLDREEVTGSDVVSVIRFYKGDPSVEILVTTAGYGTQSFRGRNYAADVFPIPYESKFSKSCTFEGLRLIQAVYIEK